MQVEIIVDIDQALKLSEFKFQEIFKQGMEAAVYKALELVPPYPPYPADGQNHRMPGRALRLDIPPSFKPTWLFVRIIECPEGHSNVTQD